VVVQNIVETSEENPKATNNFLHDDFFDEFTMCYDKDDDEENDETFHATDCDQEECAMVAAAALNNTAEPDEPSSDNRRTEGAYEYYPLVWYPREDPATHLLALLELDDNVLTPPLILQRQRQALILLKPKRAWMMKSTRPSMSIQWLTWTSGIQPR
jgi:hypothetical protein